MGPGQLQLVQDLRRGDLLGAGAGGQQELTIEARHLQAPEGVGGMHGFPCRV
ncbi:hypothetical protein D3C73_1646310 [compost metagenome]